MKNRIKTFILTVCILCLSSCVMPEFDIKQKGVIGEPSPFCSESAYTIRQSGGVYCADSYSIDRYSCRMFLFGAAVDYISLSDSSATVINNETSAAVQYWCGEGE